MDFFKSRISWSANKQRKVLSKKKHSHDVGSSHVVGASNSQQRTASFPIAESDTSVDYDRRNTVAEGSRGRQEHIEALEDWNVDNVTDATYPAVRNMIPTTVDTPKRTFVEPLFPSIPSNFAKPDLMTVEERMISNLPAELWSQIVTFVDPLDAANLALTCKTLRYRLGPEPWKALNLIENHKHKIAFLTPMDRYLPDHLFCYLCASFHFRTNKTSERLQQHYVSNPVFLCPNARTMALPRIRLTHGRELPFAYVQLATRAIRHGTAHGVSVSSLLKRWRCEDSDWNHALRFHIHENGHLLMRCASTVFVKAGLQPNEERLLLYSRSDYAPYFSVCSHWADGNLLPLCKCALSHVPAPKEGVVDQLRKGPKVQLSRLHNNMLPKMCDNCKPLRRCRDCPTEYMITLKLAEDKTDRITPFKQAICITRWSDLGPGMNPLDPEWSAINGAGGFDSAAAIKNASMCSLFEAAVSKGAPGQQLLWLEVHRDTHQDVY